MGKGTVNGSFDYDRNSQIILRCYLVLWNIRVLVSGELLRTEEIHAE